MSCARLNTWRRHWGCGFGSAEGTCYTGSHCCHLANTIEPSMSGGDAASCQITVTMTTCYDGDADLTRCRVRLRCRQSVVRFATECRPALWSRATWRCRRSVHRRHGVHCCAGRPTTRLDEHSSHPQRRHSAMTRGGTRHPLRTPRTR